MLLRLPEQDMYSVRFMMGGIPLDSFLSSSVENRGYVWCLHRKSTFKWNEVSIAKSVLC